MAYTYSKIASYTVGSGGVSSINFIAIPQNYTDLVLKLSARSTHSSIDPCRVTFNLSSSGYSYRSIFGDGSTVASYSGSSQSWAEVQYIPGTAQTASTFNNAEIYIPNYTASSYKSTSVDATQENNATTAYIVPMAWLWSNTSAITSINLVLSNGNFVQHTTATLYGIKAEL